jgi:ribonuclease P protein component
VAGKRVGGAVRRNRAKRRIRAALREVGLPQGQDVIVIAGPAVPDAPFQKLVGWVEHGLHREPARG